MEITIAASALLQEITLPMNSLQKEAADGKREQKLFPPLGMAGQNLRGCILQNCISVHPDRKSTRLNSSHSGQSRMPSSA